MENIIYAERLKLRKWINADFTPFAEVNKDTDVMQYFPKILTDDETASMIKGINAHFNEHGFGLFAVEKISTREFIDAPVL